MWHPPRLGSEVINLCTLDTDVVRPSVDLPLGRKLANFPKRRPPCNVCACPACRTSATLSTACCTPLSLLSVFVAHLFFYTPGSNIHALATHLFGAFPPLSLLSRTLLPLLGTLFVALSALQKGKIIIRHCMVIEIIVILFMSPSSPPRQLSVLWRDYHCIAPGGESRVSTLDGLTQVGDNYFKRTVIEFIII